MLYNLANALRTKKITQSVVARTIGVTDKTLTNKLNGTTAFTVDEAFIINKNFLPEYTMDYLFATDDKKGA